MRRPVGKEEEVLEESPVLRKGISSGRVRKKGPQLPVRQPRQTVHQAGALRCVVGQEFMRCR